MIRWRLPWDTLEVWGLNLHVVKSGIAAGVSWGLASWLFQAERPYFAPLAAILTLQVTVAESVSRGLQRIFGVIGGILLAFVFSRWLGVHSWSIGLTVFFALAMATRLRLGAQGIPQVAISALLVMSVGAAAGYARARALDTLVGAAVAILINALVVPPDYTEEAAAALHLLASALAGALGDIGQDVLTGLDLNEAGHDLARARDVDQALHRARSGIRRAEESLKWNLLLRHRRVRLEHLRVAITVLDHACTQVRGIARTLFITLHRDVTATAESWPGAMAEDLAALFTVMATALKTFAALVQTEERSHAGRLEAVLAEAGRLRYKITGSVEAMARHWMGGMSKGMILLDVASVVSDLEKMSQDLTVSARVLVPVALAGS